MKATLSNTTTIESPTGLRAINLYLGDICAAKDELLILSSHAGTDYPTGMVVEALTRKYSIDFSRLGAVITLERFSSVGTFRLQGRPADSHPAKDILIVRIPGFDTVNNYGHVPMEVYEEAVWTLFGSLAAWEQKGIFFRSMAMTLLGGQRGYPKQQIMQVVLRQATNWLKSSRGMNTINLYLYEADQLQDWNEAMNSVLGRRSIDSAKNAVVKALRDEILVLIEQSGKYRAPDLADIIKPIQGALATKDIYLQQVAAFGRTLVEKIVFTILHERNLEVKGILAQNIQALGYQQVVAPWMVNHMHALRVFGNETLHAKEQVSYKPECLQEDDLVAILTSLRSVIQFYAEW